MIRRPKTILVVEDDEDIRGQIVQILEDEGYATMMAINGRKALEVLSGLTEKEFPDCILLDLMMPVMNGLEFYEELRKDPKYEKVKVLLATAKGTVEGEIAGVPPELPKIIKPMDIDQLMLAIERLIGLP